MTVSLLLMVVALICFALATIGIPTNRFSLVAAGLTCWVLADIIGSGALRLA